MANINNQGVNIHYEVYGKGIPIIFLSGGMGSCQDWVEYGYVESLGEGYQRILIDVRGHGQSDKPQDTASYSMALFMEDIMAVLDELGVENFHALGFSMGGWIVYSLSRKYPERMKSMILFDGVPGVNDSVLIQDMVDQIEEFIPQIAGVTPTHRERMLATDRPALRSLAIGIADDIPEIIDDINALPECINLTGLILTSDLEDDFPEIILLRKIESAMSDASFVTLPGTSHMDILIRSDLTIPHLLRFLDAQVE